MENLEKSWNLNYRFPGLEKSWKSLKMSEVMEKSWKIETLHKFIILLFPEKKNFPQFVKEFTYLCREKVMEFHTFSMEKSWNLISQKVHEPCPI